jgi:DNA-binding response OmpR family regulator
MGAPPPSLLLVEDEPDDIALFRRALRIVRPGTSLTVARDGDEALELLSKVGGKSQEDGHPFLSHVILDLKLPRRSGLEVLEWIRRRRELREVRVVMLTSSPQSRDVERAARAGVDRYFVKPPNFTELVDVVRAILREWVLLP